MLLFFFSFIILFSFPSPSIWNYCSVELTVCTDYAYEALHETVVATALLFFPFPQIFFLRIHRRNKFLFLFFFTFTLFSFLFTFFFQLALSPDNIVKLV